MQKAVKTHDAVIEEGGVAPDFTLPIDGGLELNSLDLRGKNVVLYFYPKDDTPGCTKEAQGFRDAHKAFETENTVIIGVSKDTVKKHDKFIEKYDLNFHLISDEACELCEAYGVWVEKSMYGKKYMGIQRATFLIDGQGVIQKIWPKVSVKGHVDDVLKAVKILQN